MLYIIIPPAIVLLFLIFKKYRNNSISEINHRTCKCCGYVYPSNFNFKEATWVTSKHTNPINNKPCRWFFHYGYQTNDD